MSAATETEEQSLFRIRLAESMENWVIRTRIVGSEGLVMLVFKLLTGRLFLLWIGFVFRYPLPAMEAPARWILKRSSNAPDDAEGRYRIATDLYKCILSCGMIASYCFSACIVSTCAAGKAATVLILICLLFSILRLFELMAMITYLFMDAEYSPSNASRAVANTIWHYVELTVGFGIFYLTILHFDRSAFARSDGVSMGDDFMASVYFSFVTLTTLGYGDYSPNQNNWPGMGLICAEILSGSFILLIVLQRSLAQIGSAGASKNRHTPSNDDSCDSDTTQNLSIDDKMGNLH